MFKRLNHFNKVISINRYYKMASFNNTIQINSCFDSGNGDLVKIEGKSIHIKIRDEPFTTFERKQHKQWFHFRASGVKDSQYQFRYLSIYLSI